MAEVCVALLTPFTSSGEVAFDALEAHVDFLVGAGITSLMPSGTTGEGMLLDPVEIGRVVACVTRIAGRRARVIAHVGRASTRETIALAHAALTEGAAAVSAVVPYYYAYGDAEVRRHYLALLEAVSAPVYAYTIPERAGNALAPAVVRDLAAAGLAGVKDSTKSLALHREYLACGIDVLMGSDALVLEALRLGAAGAVSAIANVEPRLLLDIAATVDDEAAAAAQARVVAIRERTRESTSPIVALKRALSARVPGYPPHVRLPLS
jgi:dihydrodipicolinate synthase/N-acetylneuraminate lyase